MQKTTRQQGFLQEKKAVSFLKKQGLKILKLNFREKIGEIDIIAQDKNYLVFIEVKYRKTDSFGGAVFAVDKKKQEKIIKTSQLYLQQKNINQFNTLLRFDVIAINKTDIKWLKNAF